MATTAWTYSELPIVLYHYAYSPFAKRIVWYLNLRGIPYVQCLQPPIMPRPDIHRLGINYRRIPILSIGRDVYLDSRLIISKLEHHSFPSARPSLSAPARTTDLALQHLLESLAIDAGIFASAAKLLPPDLPLLKDPKFQRDRADFRATDASQQALKPMTRDEALAQRPEALFELCRAFELLETTLLADGREWLLRTEGPSLADIEAAWPLHWMVNLPGALTEDISKKQFPSVYAWIARFDEAIKVAVEKQPQVRRVSGDEAQTLILNSPYSETGDEALDGADPVVKFHELRKGEKVCVWPTDSGSTHKDMGVLVGLNAQETVIETRGEAGVVRVHAPRHGFRLRRAGEMGAKI